MEQHIVKSIVVEYLTLLNRDHLKYNIQGVVNLGPTSIEVELSVGDDDVSIRIDTEPDEYVVYIMAAVDIMINVSCYPLELEEKNVNDYDNIVKHAYDELGGDVRYWICHIPFTEKTPKCVSQRVKEWMFTLNRGHFDSVEDMLVYWYIHEVFLPRFLDQTTKHMTKELSIGMDNFTIEDFYQFINMEVENGEDLDELLAQVEYFFAPKQ